jgi:hypothetical protein
MINILQPVTEELGLFQSLPDPKVGRYNRVILAAPPGDCCELRHSFANWSRHFHQQGSQALLLRCTTQSAGGSLTRVLPNSGCFLEL